VSIDGGAASAGVDASLRADIGSNGEWPYAVSRRSNLRPAPVCMCFAAVA
jgi:hypothetical protein